MRRRAFTGLLIAAGTALAGCSSSDPASDSPAGNVSGSPTGNGTSGAGTGGTPSPTSACGDTTYEDEGEFSFEYGLKTEDGETYEGRLRFVHVRTPTCRYEDPACSQPTEETVLAERSYTISENLQYDVVDAPVTPAVDSYRVEFTVGEETVSKRGLEEAARPLVGESADFLVCDPGARRFGFLVRNGHPLIMRAQPEG